MRPVAARRPVGPVHARAQPDTPEHCVTRVSVHIIGMARRVHPVTTAVQVAGRRPVRLVCVLVSPHTQVTVACCARAHIHGTEVPVSHVQVTELAAVPQAVLPGRALVGRHIREHYVTRVF